MNIGSFSARTLGLAAQLLPRYYTHTGLETLFLTHGIDEADDASSLNKQKRVLNAWKDLPNHPRAQAVFAEIVEDLLTQTTDDGEPRDQDVAGLLTSLARDGWVFVPQDQTLVSKATSSSVDASGVASASSGARTAEPSPRTNTSMSRESALATSNRVFIVHGRDESAKDSVARFVEKLGFEAVILHEQANKGRTVLEKFLQEAADAAFAIVILSPDDEGRLADSSEVTVPRARQNVVFEFGYFVGLLGRQRVVALVLDRVEIPSDLAGLLYVEVQSRDDWKMAIAREMKEAGLVVDLNRI